MARRAGEVQADIALTRGVIERELDALHRRVPKRWWLSYAWLAGGMAAGVLLSRTSVFVAVSQGLRIIQFGAAIMGTVAMIERFLAEPPEGRRTGSRDGHYRKANPEDEVRL